MANPRYFYCGCIVAMVGMCNAANRTDASTTKPEDNFDPTRYIDTSEIKQGMKGYGLTVFAGTEPEKFEVEAISVVHNFLPKKEIILIRCLDDRHKFSKPVGGDSGSPVFFDNRLAGAMAYGWPNSSEALYGVTPIRYMLNVQETEKPEREQNPTGNDGSHRFDRSVYRDLMRRELLTREQMYKLAKASGLVREPLQTAQQNWATLPLSLTGGGFSPQAIEYLQSWFPGFLLNSGGGSEKIEPGKTIKLQRGSALTIPLVTGDISMQSLGTVTEVDGDKVFGFGHPFQSEGKASWPMGTGYIHKVVNKTDRSFKLGSAVDIVGRIEVDETAAVYGRIGNTPTMIPVNINVQWPQQAGPEQFKMKMLQHESLSAAIVSSVLSSAILMRGNLPKENTVRYQMKLDFDGAESVEFDNYISGTYGLNTLTSEALSVVALMLDDPWEKVKLASVHAEIEVLAQETTGYIKSILLAKRIYKPGQTVHAKLVVEQLRQKEKTIEICMNLPVDLTPGKYKISVGSADEYLRQVQLAQPHRNNAFRSEDIQRILQERLRILRRNVYISMILPSRGLALEDQCFDHLPASKTMLLNDKSRSLITTSFRPIVSASVPTEYVLTGGKLFDIEIRKD